MELREVEEGRLDNNVDNRVGCVDVDKAFDQVCGVGGGFDGQQFAQWWVGQNGCHLSATPDAVQAAEPQTTNIKYNGGLFHSKVGIITTFF